MTKYIKVRLFLLKKYLNFSNACDFFLINVKFVKA